MKGDFWASLAAIQTTDQNVRCVPIQIQTSKKENSFQINEVRNTNSIKQLLLTLSNERIPRAHPSSVHNYDTHWWCIIICNFNQLQPYPGPDLKHFFFYFLLQRNPVVFVQECSSGKLLTGWRGSGRERERSHLNNRLSNIKSAGQTHKPLMQEKTKTTEIIFHQRTPKWT